MRSVGTSVHGEEVAQKQEEKEEKEEKDRGGEGGRGGDHVPIYQKF